jgi:hypothetical protein
MRFLLTVVSFAAMCSLSFAQQNSSGLSKVPTVGGTAGKKGPLPTFQASNGNDILRHRNFIGKPCLAVGAFARPHAINPHLYDHVIAAVNSCSQRISMRVCYYQSQDCIQMDVPGGERKEAILGTLPSAKDFRYEFREKF